MPIQVEIRVSPDSSADEALHRDLVAAELKVSPEEIRTIVLRRRSLDVRHGAAKYVLRFETYLQGEELPGPEKPLRLQNVSSAPEVVVVGCGPAGLFAAIRLIELGCRPIVLERGKSVRDRRRDIAKLTKEGIVDPDSNYCFGEGGAGTFSDGKLYTRSNKRGSITRVLSILVEHGAADEIAVEAHPHIGTNRLPAVVEALRSSIIEAGGAVQFGQRVNGIEQSSGRITGVTTASGSRFSAAAVILAAGHSARDIFELAAAGNLLLERKPFALGVRVEHPQELIDKIQYSCRTRPDYLPAASYALRAQASGRGVFSFCMCPGGIICPAATAPGEIVVNGWSPSKRNSRFANSGIVVEVPPESLGDGNLFAGIEFQRRVEIAAYQAGGGRQAAPAARLTDFVSGKTSATLPETSYIPGAVPSDLHAVLPPEIYSRLVEGFKAFGKQVRGYLTAEAVVVAPESRTSSPIRIPRDRDTAMHPGLSGLFPCGEGAGYAGGIVSAAMDGTAAAEGVARYLGGLRKKEAGFSG